MGDAQNGLVRLLWGPHPQPKRGPKPALTLDRIARTGIEIADAEGLGALSMQRIADPLGYTKMSLYRYVPGKTELVALMVETALDETPPPESPPGAWREGLAEWSHRLSAVFRRHPWLLDATVGPRLMGPNELAWMERALNSLAGTGLAGGEQLDAVVLLTSHVRGIAQQERAAGASADPEGQLAAALGPVLRDHADRYPALLTAMESADEADGRNQALRFGLERILDGLEALIARRSAAP